MTSATVGMDDVVVSHLQYANDTIFVDKGSVDKARAVKWLLKIFKVISGLKVNFDKSHVFGVMWMTRSCRSGRMFWDVE